MSSQAVPTNSRVSWLDLGRVIAMFAVIGIHYASPDFHAVDNTASSQWLLGTFWMSFLKGEASTLFFMISGALLLPRSSTSDPRRTFGRVANLLFPLLVWSLLILGYPALTSGAEFRPQDLLFKPAYYHLWFLYAMIGVYIFLPLIKALYDKIVSDISFKVYFLVLSFIVFALNSYGADKTIPVFGLEVFFGYGMLFLLGGLTHDLIRTLWSNPADTRKVRLTSGILFVVLKAITFALLFQENVHALKATEHWINNFQLHIVVTSMCFLVFLSTFRITSPRIVSALSWLSNKIFVIYFLHALILHWVKGLVSFPTAAAIPLYTVLNFAICLAFAAVVRRTLPTRRVLG